MFCNIYPIAVTVFTFLARHCFSARDKGYIRHGEENLSIPQAYKEKLT
jgi:hypothetical protein